MHPRDRERVDGVVTSGQLLRVRRGCGPIELAGPVVTEPEVARAHCGRGRADDEEPPGRANEQSGALAPDVHGDEAGGDQTELEQECDVSQELCQGALLPRPGG